MSRRRREDDREMLRLLATMMRQADEVSEHYATLGTLLERVGDGVDSTLDAIRDVQAACEAVHHDAATLSATVHAYSSIE